MHGPSILARTLSVPSVTDRLGNEWQYHSRSDRHSRIACWGILFDLLNECGLLRKHAAEGRIGFGINHQMRDFEVNRKKDLDLVICTPGTIDPNSQGSHTFAQLADNWKILLTDSERDLLQNLPPLLQVPVGNVRLALEAKAAMTAHVRALPRLYDELNSSHLTIHAAADHAIAAAFTMVNLSEEFLSSDTNKFVLEENAPIYNKHRQPADAMRAIEKIEQIPRRTKSGEKGFDAICIVVVEMENDGAPVKLIASPPAPKPNEILHYDSMIRRISDLYMSKFPDH